MKQFNYFWNGYCGTRWSSLVSSCRLSLLICCVYSEVYILVVALFIHTHTQTHVDYTASHRFCFCLPKLYEKFNGSKGVLVYRYVCYSTQKKKIDFITFSCYYYFFFFFLYYYTFSCVRLCLVDVKFQRCFW